MKEAMEHHPASANRAALTQQHYQHYRQHQPFSPIAHDHEQYHNEKDGHDPQQYAPRAGRGSKGSSRSRAHDSVISRPRSPTPITTTTPPSPSSSVHRSISEGQSSPLPAHNEPLFPTRAHVDPEKAGDAGGSPHSQRSPRFSASNPDVTAAVYDSGEYQEKGPEDKPVQLLLFLSGPCALLSFLIALWTFVALLISALLQPFRLFSTRSTSSAQLPTFLAPPLNLQLHLIYSCATSTEYSSSMLVVVHLFSPFVAIGVAVAVWTAAFFWFFSAILGDPAGQDGHNDGRDSILGVRNWWERWLNRALR